MDKLFDDIVSGLRLGYGQATDLANAYGVEELCGLADRLRRHFLGQRYETCSIMNARSGLCSEDCKWCSQSRFHTSKVDVYPLVGPREAVDDAQRNERMGVERFSLVTSGRTMSDADIDRVCALYEEIGRNSRIKLCASMGLLDQQKMARLKAAGVTRYHCNLESAPSFFPTLCTTHTTEEKLATLRAARDAGMEICSGGIIGMGESRNQRIELAVALREAGVDSIPLNILNPIAGTALEGAPPLTDEEIMLTAAIFRITNPEVHIRLAGGRIIIGRLVPRLLHAGISAAIVGDMLTTVGTDTLTDMEMFEREGFSK